MPEHQVLEVQQGIWIDAVWLRLAGLGTRYQVLVEPGEIRIVSAPAASEQQATINAPWDLFRSLGQDAEPGLLPNAAEEHDRYLYGKTL